MPSLDLTGIASATRAHRRLLTELSPGHYELCLDNTTLEKALTCPRSFEFYAVYGRDVGERDALNYGSAIHKALEVYFLGGSLDEMIAALVTCFQDKPCAPDSWRNLDHAIEAVKRYHALRQQLPPWKPIMLDGKPAVEVPFKQELFTHTVTVPVSFAYPSELIGGSGAPVQRITVYWTGKIDLIIENNEGLWCIDHKTTSIDSPTFWDQFHLSAQMRGYTWAGQRLLGRPVAGTIIDALLGRPETKTGTAWDQQFQPYPYTQEKIDAWQRNTQHHITQNVINNLFAGYFPESNVWCTATAREAKNVEFGAKYGKCPYHDTCIMSLTAQPRILMSGMYAERTWDPLTA